MAPTLMALVTRRSSLRASSAQPSALSRTSGWFLTTASSSSWRMRQVLAPPGSLHASASLQDSPNPTFPVHGPGEKGTVEMAVLLAAVFSALLLKATRGLGSDLTAQAMACLALEGIPGLQEHPRTDHLSQARVCWGKQEHFQPVVPPFCPSTGLPFPDKSPVTVAVMCQGAGSRTCSHCC